MSTPDESRDELLAAALEQCLEDAATAPTIVQPDPDLERLRPVADLLRRLSTYLQSDPVTGQFWTSPPGGAAGSSAPPQVGKYRVLRALGAGGQAQTLLAVDPDLNRQVVLKLYHDRRPEVLDAVLREGQALARVRSPRVAQCYGVERYEGLPFLVMEFVPGRSLTDVLKEGPLAVPAAVQLGVELGEGLAAVHACGLLHRDLKPANVLIGRDGQARLVDFGLSVFHGGAAPGEVAGTLQYMAPEQAGGEADRIDPRTDVWGLGAVLYAALTGKAPYEGHDVLELLEKARLGRVRPPRELRPDLPEAVSGVVLRCLAADPAGRYPHAADVAEALRGSVRKKSRTPAARWWLGAAAAAVLVGVLAAWIDSRLGQARRPAPVPSAGWHPDGRLLRQDFALNVAVRGGVRRPDGILVLRAGDFLRLSLESSRDCSAALFHVSPDGQTECLLPNARERDNRLEAGRPRRFPAPGGANPVSLQLTVSAGTEYLIVIASTHPWQLPEAVTTRDGLFALFGGGEESLRESIRGLEWVEGKAPAKDRPLVTEQVVAFVVE
jgi:hypothetical protein